MKVFVFSTYFNFSKTADSDELWKYFLSRKKISRGDSHQETDLDLREVGINLIRDISNLQFSWVNSYKINLINEFKSQF